MNTSCRYFRSKRFNAFKSKQMFKIQVVQTRYSQCTNTSIQALHSQFSFLPAAIYPTSEKPVYLPFRAVRARSAPSSPPGRAAGRAERRGQQRQGRSSSHRDQGQPHRPGQQGKLPQQRKPQGTTQHQCDHSPSRSLYFHQVQGQIAHLVYSASSSSATNRLLP